MNSMGGMWKWISQIVRKRLPIEQVKRTPPSLCRWDNPVFSLYVDELRVADLFDPQPVEMFWCSYRVVATTSANDLLIHNCNLWEEADYTIKPLHAPHTNQQTITGPYQEFCERKTDRLWFRSLWASR